jgi:DNA-binding response OmpR family regulator
LLLVEFGPAPVVTDPVEDWIRVPASDSDIAARVDTLRRRVRPPVRDDEVAAFLDDHGILRWGDRWVSLSPLEARIVAALIELPLAAVPRQRLIEAGWPPAGQPSRDALDAHILRLRRRLHTIGLTIRTIRSRGYLIDRLHGPTQPETPG